MRIFVESRHIYWWSRINLVSSNSGIMGYSGWWAVDNKSLMHWLGDFD